MDQIRNVELTKDQIIQELLLLLRQNQRKDVANDIFEMAAYIDGMEKKLDSVLEELTNVKKQLNELQKNEIKASLILSEAVGKVGQSCHLMKEKLYEIKADVRNKAQDIVVQVKKNGKHILAKAVEFIGIKHKLEQLKENVQESLRRVNDTIEKIDAFGNGMRQSFSQAANAFRTFADKEVLDYETRDRRISKTELIEIPWEVKKKIFSDMEIFLNAAIDKVDSFSVDIEINKMEKKAVEDMKDQDISVQSRPLLAEKAYQYGGDTFDELQKQNPIKIQDLPTPVLNPVKESKSR